MKKLLYIFSVVLIIGITACNKEKSYMKRMTATWVIEKSEIAILDEGDVDNVIESVENAGKILIYDEDPENPSKESKLYDFYVFDVNGDTMFSVFGGTLLTDEKNKRMIMTKALNDSTYHSDIVWTIEENKKNQQTWTTYGIDSTLFYPPNNHNPGAAEDWIEWKIKLKKEGKDGIFSSSGG